MTGEGQLRVLAEAAVGGLPIDRMIRSRDPDEQELLEAVRQQIPKVLEDLQDRLARKIVKEYSDAQQRGKKKKG